MRLATKTLVLYLFSFLCASLWQVCGGAEGMCVKSGQEARGSGLVTEDVGERKGGGKIVSKLEEWKTTLEDMLEVKDCSYCSVPLITSLYILTLFSANKITDLW